eukprot:scaffold42830_cov222-Skeletonema_dohrnii-CCMP3373.AAC.1
MDKEIEDHEKCNNWKLVNRSSITPGTKSHMEFQAKTLPGGSLNKHKAIIWYHGGQQEYVSICSHRQATSEVAKLYGRSSKSIAFVLAFPQMEVD